jgi:hypothetical protein
VIIIPVRRRLFMTIMTMSSGGVCFCCIVLYIWAGCSHIAGVVEDGCFFLAFEIDEGWI